LVVKVTILDFYAERDRGPRLCLRMRPAQPEPVEGWWDAASHKMGKTLIDVFEENDHRFEDDLPWWLTACSGLVTLILETASPV
jgi:hypothetical protein